MRKKRRTKKLQAQWGSWGLDQSLKTKTDHIWGSSSTFWPKAAKNLRAPGQTHMCTRCLTQASQGAGALNNLPPSRAPKAIHRKANHPKFPYAWELFDLNTFQAQLLLGQLSTGFAISWFLVGAIVCSKVLVFIKGRCKTFGTWVSASPDDKKKRKWKEEIEDR